MRDERYRGEGLKLVERAAAAVEAGGWPASQQADSLRLSSQELHDLAVRRAKRHLDARFFYQAMKLLPVAEAGAGEFEKSENDITRLSAHVDDVTDSGRGEVAELIAQRSAQAYLEARPAGPVGCILG